MIRERAQEIEAENNRSLPQITSTDSELKESGAWFESRDQLMTDENTQATLSYLQELATSCGYDLVKRKSEYSEDLATFPIKDIMRYGAFVAGGRGSGKSNLLKLLVRECLRGKVEVKLKIFDPSLTWKNFPLPKLRVTSENLEVVSEWNHIYDISRLSVLHARKFVSRMLSNDLQEAIAYTDIGKTQKGLIIIEEAQNIIPSHSLRSMKFAEISRFLTQGRNFDLSFVASTQRLASCDINLVEVSGIKYWFRMSGHRNIVKTRFWLSKYETWNLRNLEIGSCYLQCGSKIKLLKLPLFSIEQVIAK